MGRDGEADVGFDDSMNIRQLDLIGFGVDATDGAIGPIVHASDLPGSAFVAPTRTSSPVGTRRGSHAVRGCAGTRTVAPSRDGNPTT
jgi:hypothetical protein